MIKVGQIWSIDGNAFVITKINNFINIGKRFDCIYKDGTTDDWGKIYTETYGELIAEYPTWQEAVNSKEFKGEQ